MPVGLGAENFAEGDSRAAGCVCLGGVAVAVLVEVAALEVVEGDDAVGEAAAAAVDDDGVAGAPCEVLAGGSRSVGALAAPQSVLTSGDTTTTRRRREEPLSFERGLSLFSAECSAGEEVLF